MQMLQRRLGSQPVLISGRGDVLKVAKSYGFKRWGHVESVGATLGAQWLSNVLFELQRVNAIPCRCVTTLQLAAALPSSTPFVSKHVLLPGQEESQITSDGLATEKAPISAVLVMTDPGKCCC